MSCSVRIERISQVARDVQHHGTILRSAHQALDTAHGYATRRTLCAIGGRSRSSRNRRRVAPPTDVSRQYGRNRRDDGIGQAITPVASTATDASANASMSSNSLAWSHQLQRACLAASCEWARCE